MTGWLEPGTLLTAIGILTTLTLGIPTLIFTYRSDQRAQVSDLPIINFVVQWDAASALYRLQITTSNPTETLWELSAVKFLRRDIQAAKIGDMVRRQVREGEANENVLMPPTAVHTVTLGTRIRPVSGERSHHVYFTSGREVRRLSIKLSLRSMDVSARSITLKVKLHMPVSTSSSNT